MVMLDPVIYYGDDLESSGNYKVRIEGRPTMTKPMRRNGNIEIGGRSGDLLTDDDSYDNIDISFEANIKSKSADPDVVQKDIDDFYAWLDRGNYQKLSLYYDTKHYYLAAFQGKFATGNTKLTRHMTPVSFSFTAKPYKLNMNQSNDKIVKTERKFTIDSLNKKGFPLIKLNGTGNHTLKFTYPNKKEVKIFCRNITGHVYLDCELMIAYREVAGDVFSMEDNVECDEYPTLPKGKTEIEITTTTLDTIEITPRWQTI